MPTYQLYIFLHTIKIPFSIFFGKRLGRLSNDVHSPATLHRIGVDIYEGTEDMYYNPWMYAPSHHHSCCAHMPLHQYAQQPFYGMGMNMTDQWWHHQPTMGQSHMELKDYGAKPFVMNIHEASKQNNTYRTALWTGKHLQVTLMSLQPGEDIGLEKHPHLEQFLRIEQGQGVVQMGKTKEHLHFVRNVHDDYAIVVPANTWHNVTNTGNIPLKIYSIYAPPQHPFGTVHRTKMDAQAAESQH